MGALGSSSELALDMALKFYISVVKALKLKVSLTKISENKVSRIPSSNISA